ncbi:Meiotic nuclear division protein 1, variant 3 [Bonamia ostreae]|uniref:Meiotic nuclear division protein 1, variant 3 n=1 Tax=Bonamia ostreae TaxID=126728 RepID=A0ABV2ANP5_9EUKA
MPKRGLSLEEKKTMMLDFFHKNQTVFTLKELEKSIPKNTKIGSMSVKEVLKSLVDDSKIDSDKIGIGTYYWAFKGKAFQAEKTRNENIIKNIEQLNETEKRLKNDLVHLKNDRNGEKRSENLKKLKRENQIVNDLEKEHDFLVQNDPIVLENQSLNKSTV